MCVHTYMHKYFLQAEKTLQLWSNFKVKLFLNWQKTIILLEGILYTHNLMNSKLDDIKAIE